MIIYSSRSFSELLTLWSTMGSPLFLLPMDAAPVPMGPTMAVRG